MNSPKLNIKSLPETASTQLKRVQPYSFVVFLVFVGLIYGFLLFRVNTLRSVEPSPDAVTSQVKASSVPRIDPDVVKQLESLKDNSVSVKALFDEARSNPFQ
jgi:hypothetical protein